jgi:hypothetical protein
VLIEGVFGLSPGAVTFDERGFVCADLSVRANLEEILRVFVQGYNTALRGHDYTLVSTKLANEFDAHHVGFAFEGAGMCYALFDLLAPWSSSRLRAFTDGAGRKHDYIATVGAGFAVARVPWGRWLLNSYLQRLEATVAWCVIDGYGFHQGIFHPERFTVQCREAPSALPAYARQLFNSGVGRSFWWTQGASPTLIRQAIERFPEATRGEMWCGVGVAAAYAGGVEARALWDLLEQSGDWSADFLSGFPFAARMRQKGENPSPWTAHACAELLKMTSDEAADLLAGEVTRIAAELEGRESQLREEGYGRLRERLRRLVGRHESVEPRSAQSTRMGKSYATQRQ